MADGCVKFPSGLSFGKCLTTKLQEEYFDGTTYIDTPGFADLRETAAREIVGALRKGGRFKVPYRNVGNRLD